jgi:hypothetical protein
MTSGGLSCLFSEPCTAYGVVYKAKDTETGNIVGARHRRRADRAEQDG